MVDRTERMVRRYGGRINLTKFFFSCVMFQVRIFLVKTNCCAIPRKDITVFQLKKRSPCRGYPHHVPREGGCIPGNPLVDDAPVGDHQFSMAPCNSRAPAVRFGTCFQFRGNKTTNYSQQAGNGAVHTRYDSFQRIQ